MRYCRYLFAILSVCVALIAGAADTPLYWYKAALVKVVDGDTLDLDVDLGFRVHVHERIRLLGINAPEVTGASKPAGLQAAQWLDGQIGGPGGQVLLQVSGQDKYGRWLGTIYRDDGTGQLVNLNQALLQAGHAVAYWPR